MARFIFSFDLHVEADAYEGAKDDLESALKRGGFSLMNNSVASTYVLHRDTAIREGDVTEVFRNVLKEFVHSISYIVAEIVYNYVVYPEEDRKV